MFACIFFEVRYFINPMTDYHYAAVYMAGTTSNTDRRSKNGQFLKYSEVPEIKIIPAKVDLQLPCRGRGKF